MRNSSHSPGCIRALPASQSCQVRRVEWMSEPAAVCDKPAASRAALISAGAGLAEGPFGPRFGWLGILSGAEKRSDGASRVGRMVELGFAEDFFGFPQGDAGYIGRNFLGCDYKDDAFSFVSGDFGSGHFNLLAPVGPGARRMRCIHVLNNSTESVHCKNYFREIFEAATPPHNSVFCRSGPPGAHCFAVRTLVQPNSIITAPPKVQGTEFPQQPDTAPAG